MFPYIKSAVFVPVTVFVKVPLMALVTVKLVSVPTEVSEDPVTPEANVAPVKFAAATADAVEALPVKAPVKVAAVTPLVTAKEPKVPTEVMVVAAAGSSALLSVPVVNRLALFIVGPVAPVVPVAPVMPVAPVVPISPVRAKVMITSSVLVKDVAEPETYPHETVKYPVSSVMEEIVNSAKSAESALLEILK